MTSLRVLRRTLFVVSMLGAAACDTRTSKNEDRPDPNGRDGGSDASQPGPGHGDAGLPALEPLVASGSRLQARVLRAPGLPPYVIGWRDTKRNEDCELNRDGAGALRCMPPSAWPSTSKWFLDKECKRELAKKSLGKAFSWRQGEDCDVSVVPVKRVGPQLALSRAYTLVGGKCQRESLSSIDQRYEIEPVPVDEFVEFRESDVPVSEKLALRIAEGDDGSRVVQGPVIRALKNGLCEPYRDAKGTLRCVPIFEADAEGAPIITLNEEDRACSLPFTHVACSTEGAKLKPEDLPVLTTELRGSGDLKQRVIVHEGVTLGAYKHASDSSRAYDGFFDEARKADCMAYQSGDESWSCIPVLTQFVEVDDEFTFHAAACPDGTNPPRAVIEKRCAAITLEVRNGNIADGDPGFLYDLSGPTVNPVYFVNDEGQCSGPRESLVFVEPKRVEFTEFPQLDVTLLKP